MPLTNKALQQTITQIFFPKEKGKHVFVWGDVNTSQRSDVSAGTVCYVNIDNITNLGMPYVEKGVFIKHCQAFVTLRFVGVDSFKYAEQASFLVHNSVARNLFREMGAEILSVSGISSEPYMLADTNILNSQNVRLKLNYTMMIDPNASKLKSAFVGGGIKVEEVSR